MLVLVGASPVINWKSLLAATNSLPLFTLEMYKLQAPTRRALARLRAAALTLVLIIAALNIGAVLPPPRQVLRQG